MTELRRRFVTWLAKVLGGEEMHLRHLSKPADGSYPRTTTFKPGRYLVVPLGEDAE